MDYIPFSTVFSIILILFYPAQALSQISVSQEVVESVLLLSSMNGRGCATGFILNDGRIFTNAHVTEMLCDFDSCSSLKIQRASALGKMADISVPVEELSKVLTIPTLDLTILRSKATPAVKGISSTAANEIPGEAVFALGFPNCRELTLSSGKITESNALHLITSTKGSHGSSGSPLFDSTFHLIGMVDEATSIIDGTVSLFTGSTFENRGIRASLLFELSTLEKEPLLTRQIDLLNSYYTEHVLSLRSWERVKAGIDFISIVDGIKKQFYLSQESAAVSSALLGLGQYPEAIAYQKATKVPADLGGKLDRLILSYNLENYGARQSLITPIDINSFSQKLLSSGRSIEEVKNLSALVESTYAQGHEGLQFNAIRYACLALLLVSLILPLWSASLGYLWAKIVGGFWRKFWITTIVGLLWPVSMVAVPFIVRRKR